MGRGRGRGRAGAGCGPRANTSTGADARPGNDAGAGRPGSGRGGAHPRSGRRGSGGGRESHSGSRARPDDDSPRRSRYPVRSLERGRVRIGRRVLAPADTSAAAAGGAIKAGAAARIDPSPSSRAEGGTHLLLLAVVVVAVAVAVPPPELLLRSRLGLPPEAADEIQPRHEPGRDAGSHPHRRRVVLSPGVQGGSRGRAHRERREGGGGRERGEPAGGGQPDRRGRGQPFRRRR
mmetsp:Transcript_39671/g.119181  ORF Transcript_39671/g.119181 Transcript_39671/m.119181 type:complete len:234 (-) Transcript_39671:1405-2106(-)